MSSLGLDSPELTETNRAYQEAIDFLLSRINYESRPDLATSMADFPLARMDRLLTLLGNPQTAQPVVHIAGSKGKGSTAIMVARILEAAGHRVGLFTSPHAHKYEERITVNGVPASRQEIVQIVERLKPICQQMDSESKRGPSFFELTTAAGWLHFQEKQTSVAVVEVGLGGRLDSTNVCNPEVAVIASISKDHTRLLGDTLEKIAREKAGIIKDRVPVVSGVTAAGPAEVIESIAQSHQSKLLRLDRELIVTNASPSGPTPSPWTFDLEVEDLSLKELTLGMPGEHQVRNAALAVATVRQLDPDRFKVSSEHLRQGLRSAVLPMRVQTLSTSPTFILDSAHNPASIQALCDTLSSGTYQKRICLFSASKDKDVKELLVILSKNFDQFILTAYQSNPRAVPIDELAHIAENTEGCRFETAADPAAAVSRGMEISGSDDLLCATGSFFFAAEVEDVVQNLKANSETEQG
ncbi:Folylpolyglutamate synthase [Thalassoglobus neptunius]|uniref:Dihydrofolate synthase/folylpolyglutamate synthase n=1 Tax=Thalassoglobus neptunius TaxID=1938619 RepID=A0A5C5X5U5_9PLAN|nr:folylpolyglutamate synthase/dihydrofolate synthase family protein [Thalassoglobus neptunius]TWT57623.1 Folylpolyglutamate synthase [Thalassoglobus neptunius]